MKIYNNLTIEEFLDTQEVIRAYPSGFTIGTGDQAACLNAMKWLRSKGFKGRFEVIIQKANEAKVLGLFGLPADAPPDYYDAKQRIKFIRFTDYYQRFQKNEISMVDLA